MSIPVVENGRCLLTDAEREDSRTWVFSTHTSHPMSQLAKWKERCKRWAAENGRPSLNPREWEAQFLSVECFIPSDRKDMSQQLVIPKPSTLRYLGINPLEQALAGCEDYTFGQSDPEHVFTPERTRRALEILELDFPDPCLILDVDLGNRYRGYAPATAYSALVDEEPLGFALDAYSIGMLLRSYEQFSDQGSCWLDCCGTLYNPKGSGKFADSCYFDRRSYPPNQVTWTFDWNWVVRPRRHRGMVWAQLPEICRKHLGPAGLPKDTILL